MGNWLPDHLPEDLDAERSFLATCCAPGAEALAAECCLGMTAETFVHPAHRAVFQALQGLLDQHEEINSLTLKIALETENKLGLVGGYAGLVDLLSGEDVGRPHRLGEHLQEKAGFRKLVHVGAELVRRASSEEDTPAALVDRASRGLAALVQGGKKGDLLEAYEFADDWMADLVARMEGRLPSGIKTGMPRFDRLTQGFKPGNLIVLAARPGIGKTALLLNWLLYMAHHGQRCAAFILEMAKEEVLGRLVSAQGGINLKDALAGGYRQEVVDRIAQAKAEVSELPFFIADQATTTVREIRARVERLIARQGRVDVVGVDYLQLIKPPEGTERQPKAVQVGEITRDLKLMAKDLGLPVVLLSQMNREVEYRQGGRPQLSDLRDSGAIEQDADLVAFIHRKMTPVPEGESNDPSAELIVAKQRDGQTATIGLTYHGETFTYRETDRATVPAALPLRRA